MAAEPTEPDVRHVWVKGASDLAEVWPGLVIGWLPNPVHRITESSWMALVLVAPHPGAMLLEWVGAERVEPVRDPTPADGT